jgi:hypothetical protein
MPEVGSSGVVRSITPWIVLCLAFCVVALGIWQGQMIPQEAFKSLVPEWSDHADYVNFSHVFSEVQVGHCVMIECFYDA